MYVRGMKMHLSDDKQSYSFWRLYKGRIALARIFKKMISLQ